MSTVTQKIQDQVASLYIAFFGRAPDAQGFGGWAQEMAAGASPFKIAADFALSPEWTSQYSGLLPTQQINRFYQNTFGRQADEEGLEYWLEEIEGGIPFSTVAFQIIWAAYLGGDTVDPDDAALVQNKVDVALYFAIELASNDTDIAETAFVGVKQDPATVTAAEARLAAAVNPPETFTLTTGADFDAALVASATFNGQVNSTGQLTWQSFDTLVGGSGVDTLNADMNGNVVTMTNVSSVENLNLNVFTNAATINAVGASFIQNVTVDQTVGLTINSLGSLPSIALSGIGATALNFTAAALAPVGQTLNLALTGKTGGGITLSDTGTNALETVSISSTGAANTVGGLTTSGLGTTTLSISGDQNLTVGTILDTNSTLRTVNASAASGNVSVTLVASSTFTGGSGNDEVTSGGGVDNLTGGLGNDTFVMGASLTAVDTIAGGDGTDTITADAAQLAAFTAAAPTRNISGIESLTLTTVAANTILLSAIQAGINDVNISTAGAAQTGTITFDSGVAGNIDVGTAAVISTLGAFTVASAGTGTADSITIDNDTAGSDIFAGAITATGVETLTLDGTTTTAAINQGTAQTITMTASTGGTTSLILQGNNNFVLGAITAGTINASALTVNLAGAQASLDMADGANTATTIIGSAGNDDLHDNNAGTTATFIDGGAGNDTITSTGIQNDTLLGGDGNDTIAGAAGNDSINGGAGNDLIIFASGELTVNDTVSGGEGSLDILNYSSYDASADNVLAAQQRVSEFEVLRLGTTGAGGVAVTLSNYTNNQGFTEIQLSGTGAGANGYTFTNASSLLNTITALGAVAGTQVFTRLTDTSSDVLTVRNATVTAADTTFTALTAVDEETINLSGSVAANDLIITTLTVNDLRTLNITGAADVIITEAIAGGALLTTVNAAAATGAVTVNATNSINAVTMTGNSASTAITTFTGGSVADVITGGGGADALVGGAGNDVISGGGGADVITGGLGMDTLTGGAGADDFIQTGQVAVGGVLNADVITDFTVAQTDQIGNFSVVNLELLAALTDLVLVGNAAASVANTTAFVFATVNAAFDLGSAVTATSLLIGGDFNATTLARALETGGSRALTANGVGGFEIADGFTVFYDNGVDTFVALVTTNATVADNALFAANTVTVTNLVTLSGVSDATTIAAANTLAFVT